MMTIAARMTHRDRVLRVAVLFFLGLLTVELALQWRSHLRWGQSIFDVAAKGETRYIRDQKTGLLLLRPNQAFSSRNQIIRSNSLGLRSPEPMVPRPAGGIRIAVIGASSVFGAYAADNDLTFSQLLAARLSKAFPEKSIEVINAGQVGLSLQEQITMLSKVALPLHPDWIILYSGANDFVKYCRNENKPRVDRQPLWRSNLTSVLLTFELVTKNTVGVRKQFAPLSNEVAPDSINLESIENSLRTFVEEARNRNTKVLLATNARSYRPNQPVAVQEELAGTALYYNYCFSLAGLHRMHDRVNAVIEKVATTTGTDVVPLDRLVPGGAKYFADANHFTEQGERLVAETLFAHIAPSLAEMGGDSLRGDSQRVIIPSGK